MPVKISVQITVIKLQISALGSPAAVLVAGGPQGWLHEKIPEISPVPDRAHARQLQVRPAAGQG